MSYIVGHPIKHPADFYGRYEQIARFYEIIGGTQAQSVTIRGVRRAGKTSFLQYIANKEVMAKYLSRPEQYAMIYVDISSCKTPTDFYQRLLRRMQSVLGESTSVNLWKGSADGITTMYDVEAYLCQFPDRRIILLLDEFDQMRTDTFTQDFLTELRAMTSVLDYDLACVTASYWDLYYLGNKVGLPPTSPFYNIFYPSPLFLPGLEDNEIETLIRSPIEKTSVLLLPEEIDQIRQISGTLPFFVQATAAQWYRRKRAKKEVKPRLILRQLAADLSPYFDQWWRYLDGTQQKLLYSLSHKELMDKLPYGSVELSEAIRHLQNYGLLRKEQGKLVINGAIFMAWIRQYARLNVAEAEAVVENGSQSVRRTNGFPDLGKLRHTLMNHFDLEEMQNLCFDMGMDYELLPGRGKGSKARSMIEYWRKRQDLDALIEAIRRERGAIV